MHRSQCRMYQLCLISRVPHQLRRATPPCQKAQQRRHVSLAVVAARDPYEVLGIGRSASLADVKRAYRTKALKLHPDVNKAPDAKERFMECKNAYQDIVESGKRSTRRDAPSASSAGRASWGGGDSSGTPGGGQRGSQTQEEFYGLGDLYRDLEREWDSYSSRRRRDEAAGPKSLWEELADIGEELVEFLEKGIGLSEGDAASGNGAEDVYERYKKQYESGSGQSTARPDPTSSGPQTTGSKPGGSSGGASRSGTVPPTQKSQKEVIDEDLEELKRKMGLK